MADSLKPDDISDDIVIQVDDLSKHYGELKAVDGISFGVARGEVFGILGPNGAGKTTTLECIEGIVEPTGGKTSVLGMDTRHEAQKVKERIGVQLQASAYFDYLTLKEILDLFGMFYSRRVGSMELLEEVNLADRADTPVNKLSGGQQQRFSIAATLVNDPDVVFLDEPTTGLDPQARQNLWRLVRTMNRGGRTIVLTTHYMEEAEHLCDRIAIMDGGKIVALDTPANLIAALPVPFEIRLTLSGDREWAPEIALLGGIEAVSKDGDTFRIGCADAVAGISALTAWAKDSGVEIARIEVAASNLEDVFLSITGHELRE